MHAAHGNISVEERAAGAFLVTARGELDLVTAYAFDAEMRELESREPQLLVLDLRAVSFLDCSGLARIAALQRRARAARFRLVVVRGSRCVRRLFVLTQIDLALEQVDHPDEALAPPRPATAPAAARVPPKPAGRRLRLVHP